MSKMPKTYHAIYERDGSMWFARLVESASCHTQGRTITQARERIREAIGLFDRNAARAKLVDDVRLPKPIAAELREARVERTRVERMAASFSARVRFLARALVWDMGVSLGDAGELLGVSKERVRQLLVVPTSRRRRRT